MLRKNSTSWEGKVRAVIVNRPGVSMENIEDEQGNKIFWKSVQYL